MIRLHHAHQTRSMRTLWLLYELGAPFEVEIYPFGRALQDQGYLDLHPMGRVPSLEMDGEVYWETGALAEILCERFPEAGMGRAVGDGERAAWLVWVHFAETISQHAAALTQQHIMLFEDWMRSPVITKLEAKRLARCYAAIEAQLDDGRDYLLAGGFSAADVGVGQAVYMARHFAKVDPFPKAQAWYDRIAAREAFAKSLPPEGEGIYGQEFYPILEAPQRG